jgi:hypothetical protein
VAVEGELCSPHFRKAAAAAQEACAGPSAASDVGDAASADAVAEADPDTLEELAPVDEAEPVRIESLRAALREGSSTAEVAELVRQMLLDGLRASKTLFHTCTKCGKKDPVTLPDLSTRISATRALVEELDGRVKSVPENDDPRAAALLQKSERSLASCTDEELEMIVLATHDGESPSMKGTARRLATELLANADANPQGWLAERLSPAELEFLKRVSARHHWGSFPASLIELAEEVAALPA